MSDEKVKKSKKLSKLIEGNILTITESVTGNVMTFDAATLPRQIQSNLMPYGLSQKLGDAAAGREGQEAVDAINRVFAGLVNGDWSTRVPAAEKVTKKGLESKVDGMAEGDEKNAYKALLAKLFATK